MMDNIIVRVLSRIFDFILLNILWVICSLPVVTIGASTTALYTVMLKITVNEEGYILKGFLQAFKDNFKQSTIIWLILLAAGVLLGVDFMFLSGSAHVIARAGTCVVGIIGVIYIFEIVFAFPLVAKFENSTMQILKNAILIPVSRLPFALLVLLLTGMCIAVTFLNTTTVVYGAVVWTLIGVSLLTYANSFLLCKIFEPYISDKITE